MDDNKITHKQYLSIAIPFIFSTITQPLLGAADTAVVGRLGSEAYIGGVSVGAVLFNTMYWLFGFLRVSTTGFSAQAKGEDCTFKKSSSFLRPLTIAIFISMFFVIFQTPIFNIYMYIINPGNSVLNVTRTYYKILVFGAPFVLINYVVLGWLMGQTMIKQSLIMQITGNVVNIILDILFVFYFKFGVAGVAYATLISQCLSTIIGISFIKKHISYKDILWKEMFNKKDIVSIMTVNVNLMLRTVCLLIHNNVFTATSASFGTVVLSANAVLLQIQSIISYSFDGIANASSVFSGKSIGKSNNELMKDTWKKTLQWGIALVIFTTGIYLGTYTNLISIFTNLVEVKQVAINYGIWVSIYPIVAFVGLTFYGVFTGASKTKPVFKSTFLGLVIFLIIWKVFVPIYGNNGLWISLLSFYFARSVFLVIKINDTLIEDTHILN